MALEAPVRVPGRGPLPGVGNINKTELLSQLEFETLNMGRQPSYVGGKSAGRPGQSQHGLPQRAPALGRALQSLH